MGCTTRCCLCVGVATHPPARPPHANVVGRSVRAVKHPHNQDNPAVSLGRERYYHWHCVHVARFTMLLPRQHDRLSVQALPSELRG